MARTFKIEAKVRQEDRNTDTERNAKDAAAAVVLTRSLHALGLWVEVFDLDSGELVAGPFDPDELLPRYIV